MQEPVISVDVKIEDSIRRDILDDTFWQHITIAGELLKPIARGIKVLEGDSPNLSLVPRVLMDIRVQIINSLKRHSSLINTSTSNTMLKQVATRFDFCCKGIHKAAYYVDSRFRGEGLSDEDNLNCLEVIKQFQIILTSQLIKSSPTRLCINQNQVFTEGQFCGKLQVKTIVIQ